MADQDYPSLYADLEASAQRTRGAAIAFEAVLGGSESQLVPVNGYGNQPTIAGRVKARLDPLTGTIEAAAQAVGRWVGAGPTAPTKRLDGTPLQQGDEWQNTTNNLRYNWAGSAWVPLNASVQDLGEVLGQQITALTTDLATTKAGDIWVENFRMNGPAVRGDAETIQAALAWIVANVTEGLGSRLIFQARRTYVYDSTSEISYVNNLVIDLNGARLLRAPASATTAKLAVAASISATTLTLDAIPANWKVGDTVAAFSNALDANTSRNAIRINAINQAAKTITLAGGIGAFGSNTTTIPAGVFIGKNYQCFLGRPSTEENGNLRPGINHNIQIINGIIDGNKANQLNNSWRFSMEIFLNGRSSGISGVKFLDTAGECIVGHGLRVEGCEFRGLSGSAYHLSRHDDTTDAGSASWFTNNYVDGVCLAGNAVNGHSEGAVTFSWGAGRLIVANNEFRNGGEGVLGGFGPSSGEINADKWLVVTGNLCLTFNRVFWGLFAPLQGIVVSDNVFVDCNDNTVEMSLLLTSPSCSAGGNVAIGNTVLSGSLRATNAAFGDDMSGTLTQTKLWARGNKLRSTYTTLSEYTAVIEANTALVALMSADNTGSGLAFLSAGGHPVGSFYLQWLPQQKKLQFLGVETGAKVEFTTPVSLGLNRLNVVLPVFASDAAAKAAGLVVGDMYKTAAGAVYNVS